MLVAYCLVAVVMFICLLIVVWLFLSGFDLLLWFGVLCILVVRLVDFVAVYGWFCLMLIVVCLLFRLC